MNIAEKLMSGSHVSEEELKHLLWITLCELESVSSESEVAVDSEEIFSIEDLLNTLSILR
jgi:hypothetical protein